MLRIYPPRGVRHEKSHLICMKIRRSLDSDKAVHYRNSFATASDKQTARMFLNRGLSLTITAKKGINNDVFV